VLGRSRDTASIPPPVLGVSITLSLPGKLLDGRGSTLDEALAAVRAEAAAEAVYAHAVAAALDIALGPNGALTRG